MRIPALCLCLFLSQTAWSQPAEPLRVGMIGLDTSHSLAFTRVMNEEQPDRPHPCRVIAAFPHGSADIESSVSRIPKYTAEMQEMGIRIVDTIPALLEISDAILLETNDGRPHLEQVAPVLKAGKPCFIDKPIAGSLADCLAIFLLARHYGTPVFSSSSLRYGTTTQAARGGALGDVTGCSTWSPCSLEPTHPDLFWYGIHGVESLFTVMGPGVKQVTRTQTEDFEFVTGVWDDGRIGSFRGIRSGKAGYGGTAFGTKSVGAVGNYDGYAPLVVEIMQFFHTREVPIDPRETIDIYAFMAAADISKERGFVPVDIEAVLKRARTTAQATVQEILGRP